MDGLTGLGAAELARRIRAGDASPREVVDAHIARISEIEPKVNALVTAAFYTAASTARRRTESGVPADPPPLWGVPVTVKDAIPVAGMRFTAGSNHLREHVADRDAEAVRRLRDAGAIILGKSSCSEMSGSPETDNPVVGLTRNPWNADRSAGGSSGGEAAVIAGGGSPLGLGSDIAGSIRVPAAFCGVVGLKPTPGRIPTEGHVPESPSALAGWNTVGPLARRVEDLRLALSVLSASPATADPLPPLADRRVLLPPAVVGPPVSREVADTVRDAAGVLGAAGMSVRRRARLPMTRTVLETTAVLHRHWLPSYRRSLGGGRAVAVWRELTRHRSGNAGIVPASLAPVAIISSVGLLVRAIGFGRAGSLEELRSRFLDEMRGGALLLLPVFPTTARRHGFSWGPYGGLGLTAIFNALGFPAVSVPMGLSDDGLPLSVQIVAGPGEDEAGLAAAAVLEREFGGWRMAMQG
ncbi:MAG: amidase [Gammaproteobacteria bacterium]|nr:amidase [Gammaproteobacteria bacterium]